MKHEGTEDFSAMHGFLYGFNGLVVLLLAAFMSFTQEKIVQSMTARHFLEVLPAAPWPAPRILGVAVISFVALYLLSHLYRRAAGLPCRYLLILLETLSCVCIMRSINMAYDGVVLLVVADFVHSYRGARQRILLAAAMLGLYGIADWNVAAMQQELVPLAGYTGYYMMGMQGWLKAAVGLFTSLNLIFFVLYMTMLVQSQYQEKERIRSLNEQLAELNSKLGKANGKLRAYAMESEHMAETRERNRLAREIHDTLGHALTGIVAGLDACLATFDAAPSFTKAQLPKLRAAALRGITDVRRSVKKLRPDDLERLSPREAVHQMAEGFAASTGMEICFRQEEWPAKLREDEAETIYRVVQESITNANRHGRAQRADITIRLEASCLHIVIQDDGTGCQTVQPGFGLRHMQERLELLKGRLEYTSGQGFLIDASIPLQRQEDREGWQ
jgi:signal transduction histidine kinase